MTKWLTGKYLLRARYLRAHTDLLQGPKNPGLIILEHELSNQAVQAFMTSYPLMKSNGWNVTSAAQLAGNFPYQNSHGSESTVIPAHDVIVGSFDTSVPLSATATSTAAP